MADQPKLPLARLRVLDAATLLAAPAAAEILGDFGAEVIKIELPGVGDQMRGLAPHKNGVGLWWKVTGRNKKSVTLDIRKPRGKELFLELIRRSDVLVENFRPGTLERWGLGPEVLRSVNPKLVVLRTTGFGQTGPMSGQHGYGRVAETMSGLAYITGDPDRPPIHAPFPLGDYVSGLFGTIGILVSLYHRDAHGEGRGQVVDLGLYESMFRLLEFLVVEYDQLGIIRERTGNWNPSVTPTGVFKTRDGKWISIVATAQSSFVNLMRAIGRPDLGESLSDMVKRVAHRHDVDEAVGEWLANHTLSEVEEQFKAEEVPYAPVLNIADLVDHPQYLARENIITVDDRELGQVRMQGVVPKLSDTPGTVRHAGPALGEHTAEVLGSLLGLDEDEISRLRCEQVI